MQRSEKQLSWGFVKKAQLHEAEARNKKKARSVNCGLWKNPAITYFRA